LGNLTALAALLCREGYTVYPVNNEGMAMEMARYEAIDVILISRQLPRKDGHKICRRFRAMDFYKNALIIFVDAQDNLRENAKTSYCDHVVHVSQPLLLEKVRAHINAHFNPPGSLQHKQQAQAHIDNLRDLCQQDQVLIIRLIEEIKARRKAEEELQQFRQELEMVLEERTAELEDALDKEQVFRAQLIQADRIRSMERLAAAMAHEIKNPMQSVLGCLGLAEEALQEGRSADKYFAVARDAVHRVSAILDRMHDYTYNKHETRELSDVNAVLENVTTLTRQHLQTKNTKIDWKVEKLPKIWMVPDQINQVFLNLLLNAGEAMPNGGVIRIRTGHTEAPSGVTIDFTDQGVGISPDDIGRVFEPFFTTKADGTGLGLSVSYSIIEKHRGQLSVTSRLGEGSTFTVWLPVSLR